MELCYKDELHLIGKGYKKLTNSINKLLKDPKKRIPLVSKHNLRENCHQNLHTFSSVANKINVF